MLLDLKHPAYAWYVMVMYLAWTLFDNIGQPVFSKTDARNQGLVLYT